AGARIPPHVGSHPGGGTGKQRWRPWRGLFQHAPLHPGRRGRPCSVSRGSGAGEKPGGPDTMQGRVMASNSDTARKDAHSDDPTAAPGQTAVLDRQLQEREQLTDDGDHDRFAHYVRKDKVTQAALDGSPVIALCGKVWVPGRDPEKYP